VKVNVRTAVNTSAQVYIGLHNKVISAATQDTTEYGNLLTQQRR